MKRIICIGNRYIKEDSAGSLVYDNLSLKKNLPPDLEIIDGGLAGLNLLPFFETSRKVILVDQIKGADAPGGIVAIDPEDVASTAENHYNHFAGVAYLLRVLPEVCMANLPDIHIIGIQGNPDRCTIKKAANLALKMAI
jgi:hydrogenase maturation protease